MNDAIEFLETNRLLTLATSEAEPWISFVYYGVDSGRLYFISDEGAQHSQHIVKDAHIAFGVAWYDPTDHINRKAIQGKGACRIATVQREIEIGVQLHNDHFPEFAERVTVPWVMDESNTSHVWVIEPTYIKFWNDALYGKNGWKEFFSKNI